MRSLDPAQNSSRLSPFQVESGTPSERRLNSYQRITASSWEKRSLRN